MNIEILGQMIADQADQLDALRALLSAVQDGHDVLSDAQDAMGEAVQAMLAAVAAQADILRRHDDTLRRIHRGLHSTSDPEMYPVRQTQTEKDER
jgi:ABC-type transporter Mla subunit MlaD